MRKEAGKGVTGRRCASDAVRRAIGEAMWRALTVAPGNSRGVCGLYPKYVVVFDFNDQMTFLHALTLKDKGKRRVYCNSGFYRTDKDIFVSYMTKQSLMRLCRDSKLPTHLINVLCSIYANRWVMTQGRPATECASLHSLYVHTLAYETESSRSNKLPTGTVKEGKWSVFQLSGQGLPAVITSKILCGIKDFPWTI